MHTICSLIVDDRSRPIENAVGDGDVAPYWQWVHEQCVRRQLHDRLVDLPGLERALDHALAFGIRPVLGRTPGPGIQHVGAVRARFQIVDDTDLSAGVLCQARGMMHHVRVEFEPERVSDRDLHPHHGCQRQDRVTRPHSLGLGVIGPCQGELAAGQGGDVLLNRQDVRDRLARVLLNRFEVDDGNRRVLGIAPNQQVLPVLLP